ncbi:MAG: cytochrome o ubiquinol oxidase subunit I, partial [Parachlamydiaceae bacterium]
MGATRRLDHYEASTGWQPLFILVAIGALIIFAGILVQVYDLFMSIKDRNKNRDVTGDPWNGRTLEWATSSPPPEYNFAIIPTVDQRDPLWAEKRGEAPKQSTNYQDIYLPKNTSQGLIIGVLSIGFGFGMTWYMYWLAAICFIGIIAVVIMRLSQKEEFHIIPKEEVARIENAHRARVNAL